MTEQSDMALSNIGIAITRPLNQAQHLSQQIKSAGGMVIPFPLIEIAPLEDYTEFDHVIAEINQYDWIIFISSNAVQNGLPPLKNLGIPDTLQFAAIGPVTAKALQQFGIQDVHIPAGDRFDSEALLALPEMQAMQGKRVMIVRGIGGRELLANALTTRGATVTFAECYQRINPQTNCAVLAQAILKRQLNGIVITSSEAMRHLLDLAGDTDWIKQVTLFVNHARIAEQAIAKDLTVKVAAAPGDEAMMQLITSTYQ